ncbi:sugar transferase [Candidatus Methylomirabilis sp.]|uniref:sugar transferase n=1 Tax=Candidatus Methylomirabilis sp. TaxID=2032687 RepID=UPI003C792CEC
MFRQQSQQLRRVTVLLDVSLTVFLFMAAFWLRKPLVDPTAQLLPHLALLPIIGPLWVFLLIFFNAYRSPRGASASDLCWAVTRAVATGLVLLFTLVFLLKLYYVSRVIVVAFGVLDTLALSGVRLGIVWYLQKSLRDGDNFRKVLIIGSGNRAKRLAETLLQSSEIGIQLVGYLDPDPARVGMTLHGSEVLGTVDAITSVLKDHVIDEVILAVPRGMIPNVEKIVYACEEEGVKVSLMADLFDVNVAHLSLDQFDAIPLLTFESVAQEEWKLFVKRALDLLVAMIATPVLLLVMGIIALAIKLDSPGPVFFIQDRVGLHKRRFRMLKFRTMADGSERLQAELESMNEAEGPIFKIFNDPRVTRVGRFLRRTSLDELPQIFNVIRGEMSLVGPRPMALRDVNLFDRGIQRKRFSVKPGITCVWQISGRSNLPFSKWLELDLWYINHWSLWLDLQILLKTIPAVLRRDGAA